MKLNKIGKLIGIASISYFSAIVAVNQLLNVSSLKVVAVDDDTEPTGRKSSFTEKLNKGKRIYTKDGKAFAVIDSEGYLVRIDDTI